MMISSLMILSIILFGIYYIKHYYYFSSSDTIQKSLFYPGLVFIITTIISLITITSATPNAVKAHCDDKSVKESIILQSLISVTYSLHAALVFLTFFIRIKFVFKSTLYAFSNIITIICTLLFIMLILPIPIRPIFEYLKQPVMINISDSMQFLSYILLLIILITLFVNRLIKIYKYSDADESMVATITNTTLLVSISISITILLPIFWYIQSVTNSLIAKSVYRICTLIDIYTNFLCVILSYKAFNSLYQSLCGIMDGLCRLCWFKIINKNSQEIEEIQMETTTKHIQIATPSDTAYLE